MSARVRVIKRVCSNVFGPIKIQLCANAIRVIPHRSAPVARGTCGAQRQAGRPSPMMVVSHVRWTVGSGASDMEADEHNNNTVKREIMRTPPTSSAHIRCTLRGFSYLQWLVVVAVVFCMHIICCTVDGLLGVVVGGRW